LERYDIQDRTDIQELIVAFYKRAFADELIGHIFTDVMHMDLEAHMPIMCDFWETILFQTGAYRRNAFEVHHRINQLNPISSVHFQRWEDLWHDTIDEMFEGEKANLAKLNASRISGSIQRRLTNAQPPNVLRLVPPR
jgi:hemoglobin